MKYFSKLILSFITIITLSAGQVFSHSVQVQWCVSCSGDLRIWLEHWHDGMGDDPNSTTMTISVTINGTTTTTTSAPGGSVSNMTPGQLPGCSTPITYAAGCPGEENTYNDWVYYDFSGLPQNVPISFTIISGNTEFTEDACGMYPLTVNFTIPNLFIGDQNICLGDLSSITTMGASATWTNNNPSFGLPASGTGSIPSFIPVGGAGASATITYVDECSAGSFDYTIVPQLNFLSTESNYNGYNISCNGYSDGYIDLSVTGSSPYSYLWSTSAITEGISNLSAETYSVDITDSYSCTTSASFTLTEPAILQASGFVSQYILGLGNANGEITAQVIGGIPPYNYSINNGVFTSDSIFQNLSASTYLLEYEDSNSCLISENIILNNPAQLSGYATILSPVTCNGYCDGSLELVNNNFGIPPYTYSLNGGPSQSSNIFDSLCGDSVYYISLLDSQNGFLVDTIYLSQPDSLLFSTSSSFPCNGGIGGIVLSNPTGGNGAPISYSFDGGLTFSQSFTQSGFQAGTYFLAVEDALGCVTYDTTVLTEPLPITIDSAISSNMSCNSISDGSINIFANGGVLPYSYLWNDGQISQQAVGLSADTFSCNLTDSNGCSANTSIFIISEPAVLLVTSTIIDNLIPFSSLAAININISGGTGVYTTNWDGPNNFSSTDLNIDSLFSGVYYLSVQDENLCIFQDTLEVIDPVAIFGCTDSLALNYNPYSNIDNGMCYYCNLNYNLYYYMPSSPVSCDGWMSVYVPLGTYPINYYWSNGGSSWSITGLCNDTFSVTIIDDNLCGADTSILLSNFVGCMDDTMYNYDPLVLFNDSSCVPYVFGCTDSTQFNYDPAVNTDDGSCEAYVYGCNDINAANYNPLVNTNDGSCWYCVYGCMDQTMFNFDSTATCNDSCITVTYGCIDLLAINYDSLANTSDGSCIPYFAGCTDIIAINYDALANTDDGSCCFISGCTDSTMYNYSSLACFDDSSCIPFISGCTDSLSFNYDPMANVNDTSCYECSFTYHSWLIDTTDINTCGAYVGINNLLSINSSPLNYTWSTLYGSYPVVISQPFLGNLCLGIYSLSVVDNMGCIFSDTIMIGNVILGCTDSTATNYDSSANVDDASCCAAPIVDLTIGNWYFIFDWACPGNDTTYYINFNTNGTWSNSYSGLWQLCGDQYTHTYFNDQTVYTGIYSNGIITGTMTDGISSNIGCFSIYLDSSSVVFGCTDSAANNYDTGATSADGSCTYDVPGCTDATACNYYPLANIENGSCEFTSCVGCSGDPMTGLFVSGIIDDRAVANFDNMNTYDAAGNQVCRVDQIRIRYREVGTTTWSTKSFGSPTSYDATTGICNSTQRTDKAIIDLTLGTTYEWEVKLWYCSTGATSWAVGPAFTTAGECPNVGNFTAYGANPTKATFDWDDSNGSYEFVRIKMRVDSITNPQGTDWFQVGGFGVTYGTFTKNKSGLVPGETYRAQARAFCDPNGGAYNSLTWTPLVYWTQPTSVRLEGGTTIANLAIYPNPSRDIFNLSFTSEDTQDLKVRILNVIGEEIINENLEQFIGEYTKRINLSENAKGIYFLEIETNDGVVNKKLILQ